ncbi:MAG: RIP metalloprotease RseP [Fibrobacteraceae bacterium]|nr:RIP metalloprotease RseP [Fibrobacteraceae bacterium]
MSNILSNILMFALGLVGLSFLVFIHELGHFLVAKYNKVRVKTFSIGFGKKLFRYRLGETEYCISAIPFGGYVAMAGENPDSIDKDEGPTQEDFLGKSVGARAAIAFAGPFVNIIFAFFLLIVLYMVGVQEPDNKSLIIGFVTDDGAAAEAGIVPGDTITAIDGKPTQGWDDFREQIGVSLGAKVQLEVHRGGEPLMVTVVPKEFIVPAADSLSNPINMGIGDIGIYPRNRVIVRLPPVAGSAAERAGILQGDTIFEINGEHISRYEEVVRIIDGSKGAEVRVKVIRGSDTLIMPLTASYNEEYKRYMVGIQMGYVLFSETHLVRRGPVDAFTKTCATSWKMTTSIFRYFKRLFQGQVKMDAFSGPVSIVAVMGNVWMKGFQDFLMLLALISINLGVMNLLPLAITDGGLLMFLGIEKLRGKPLSLKTQTVIQNVAAAFFISFFVFITFLDLGKLSLFLK